jgi:hypothetical protein
MLAAGGNTNWTIGLFTWLPLQQHINTIGMSRTGPMCNAGTSSPASDRKKMDYHLPSA